MSIFYKTNLIEFATLDGLFLPGLLFEPIKKSRKVLLVLHGNGTSSVFYSVLKNNEFAEKLTKQGISYFAFNNRGAHLIKRFKKINQQGQEEAINYGSAYEKIRDSIIDIDSALDYLETLGYREFYLLGYSTGANKICVYNYNRPNNRISKYILAGGGDDTGLLYQQAKNKKQYFQYLEQSRIKIQQGQGEKLVPKYISNFVLSYQAYYDMANPDGDYNVFPFLEALFKIKLSRKPLFLQYQSLTKPTLVVYGQNDEYCYNRVHDIITLLKKYSRIKKSQFSVVESADHGFSKHIAELSSLVVNWLIQ